MVRWLEKVKGYLECDIHLYRMEESGREDDAKLDGSCGWAVVVGTTLC